MPDGPYVDPTMFMTPGFNPNAPDPRTQMGGPVMPAGAGGADPLQILTQILQPQQSQVSSSLGQRLISAIPGAVGVGLSNNPAEALLQQLNQRQVMQEQERQRQFQIQMQNREFALRELSNLNQEKRQIAGETRAEQAQIRKEKRDYSTDVVKNNTEFSQKKELANMTFDNQKKITDLENFGKKQVADLNNQAQLDYLKEQSKEKRIINSVELSGSYMLAGMPASMAKTIATKRMNDEQLTPSEQKALDTAYARMRAIEQQKIAGKHSGEGLGAKQIFSLATEMLKTPHVQLSNGTVVEASSLATDPVTGEKKGADGSKVVKVLSAQETLMKQGPQVLAALSAFMSGKSPQQTMVQNGTPDALNATRLDSIIQTLKGKSNDDQIMKLMDEAAKAGEYTQEEVDAAKTRNKLKSKPQVNVFVDEKGNTRTAPKQTIGGILKKGAEAIMQKPGQMGANAPTVY